MSMSHTQAQVAFDTARFGVKIMIRTGRQLRAFDGGLHVPLPDDDRLLPDDLAERATLRIEEEEAHALYEALGDYFGHGGASTQALRRDYDAERKRVDRLIDHLTSVKP